MAKPSPIELPDIEKFMKVIEEIKKEVDNNVNINDCDEAILDDLDSILDGHKLVGNIEDYQVCIDESPKPPSEEYSGRSFKMMIKPFKVAEFVTLKVGLWSNFELDMDIPWYNNGESDA